MSMSYMWEVFYTGARGLATGRGRIQERLENTFGSYLAPRLIGPNMSLLPELAEKAQALMERVSCKPAKGDEGTIAATCREMSDEEARKITGELFDSFNDVGKLDGVEEARHDRRLK